MPSGFVSTRRSPGLADPLRSRRSGWAAPITASPYLGSASRIVCPPASVPPPSRTFAAAPARISLSVSPGRSSGNAAIESANRTRPPIAKTSDNAFAAAISPNVRGSSTSGGKKSTVPMIARSSLTRYTAPSSGGFRPAINSSGAAAEASAPRPASASARRSAPSFAAQPPQSVISVSRSDLGSRAVTRSMIGRCGAAPFVRQAAAVGRPCARDTISGGSGRVPVGPLVFKTSGAALGAARWVRLPRAPATEDRCRPSAPGRRVSSAS